MRLKQLATAAAVALTFQAGIAGAAGTLIAAANRVDMVHDAKRGLIYVTNGGQVLRYHEASHAFIDPITLGGDLGGVDLSPDGSTLAVADRSSSNAQNGNQLWVHLVHLDDLAVSKAAIAKDSDYEGGSWALAYDRDGGLVMTSRFNGSGWVPMRRLDADGNWSTLASVRQDTMPAASGDGTAIAFAEANISDGRWGRYDVQTGELVQRQWYENGTSWFNFEIATNADGSQFAIPTYGGTFIYDQTYTKVATLGEYAGAQPIGGAYHPVEAQAYFPWAGSREVRVFETEGFAEVARFDFEDTFQTTGNWAFRQGRTRLARDGSLLMVSVTGGVRFLRLYAPLSAAPVGAQTEAGKPVALPLGGTIGNGGQLVHAIAQPPAHGTVSLDGSLATYTPAPGYVGSDVFRYRVSYGTATVEADASITVKGNRPPVAGNDVAQTRRNTAVSIAVLANDSDPDGDALSISQVSQPNSGSVMIQGSKILYTPPRNYSGTTAFSYTVADGKGGQATAQVTVTTAKR